MGPVFSGPRGQALRGTGPDMLAAGLAIPLRMAVQRDVPLSVCSELASREVFSRLHPAVAVPFERGIWKYATSTDLGTIELTIRKETLCHYPLMRSLLR